MSVIWFLLYLIFWIFQVTLILRKNEFYKDFTSGSVKSYDSNQLASNEPTEDTRSEALCKITPGE